MNKKTFTEITDTDRVFLCPTDTIYGLSARVDDEEAQKRIIELKGGEAERKGFVVLIPDIAALEQFGITLSQEKEAFLAGIWPGPVSVIFPEVEGYAFRVPDYPELQTFLLRIGPIISTSANIHGEKPAESAEEAYLLFGDAVDAYIDVGTLSGAPSTLIQILR